MKAKQIITGILSVVFLSSCHDDFTVNIASSADDGGIVTGGLTPEQRWYPSLSSDVIPLADAHGNIIPDFSRVGYQWGDRDIPNVAQVEVVEPLADDTQDARALIQDAIDRVAAKPLAERGAILLKSGRYRVFGQLNIPASGIVLRGEGREAGGTRLIAAGTGDRTLISFEGSGNRAPNNPTGGMNIKDDYVPVGRFWVRVSNPNDFQVGDNVVLYRAPSELWIKEIRMNQIPGAGSTQWIPSTYAFRFERVVTMIRQDTIHFENPVVMAIEKKYGGGALFKYTYANRIEECGVEYMLIESEYLNDQDENHSWIAVQFQTAQHCWVRGVTARYFSDSAVAIENRSKNISVLDCECTDHKSLVDGTRRYSFCNNGSLSLFADCLTRNGRHDYVTGPREGGPNVFLRSSATATLADIGPHHRWNMGTLYDNIVTDGFINIRDRGELGSGHGWAGANNVLWNCRGFKICVQSPWVSAYNYSIGSVGTKDPGLYTDRPDGVWISHGEHVSPGSLYEAQLALRRAKQSGGVFDIR